MPKGYIGESKSSRAHNNMDRFISNSGPSPTKDLSLAAQLRELHGSDWRSVVDEMRRETDPAYLAGKRSAALFAEKEWRNTPAMHRTTSLQEAIEAGVAAWISRRTSSAYSRL